jgi:hypothetical protein
MNNLTRNLSVTPTTRKVKRENRSARGTTKVSPDVPPECAVCGYALRLSGKCSNYECTSRLRSKGPSVFSFDDLVKDAPPPLFHGRHWGEWVLDIERLCLVYRGEPVSRGDGSNVTKGVPPYTAYLSCWYEIDIERIHDSAAVLDWIYQVSEKFWATARVTKDLLNAFNAIFHPQASLCSGACGSGRGGKVIADPTAFLKHRIATVGMPSGPLKDAA